MAKRWSKLARELYKIIDPTINFQIHCTAYPMKSRRGSSDLPRYFITLDSEIIFDYPKNFATPSGDIKNLRPAPIAQNYPYNNDISAISELIRDYINTPKDEILHKHFEYDFWGLANILRAADVRIGVRRLEILRKKTHNIAACKVIDARLTARKADGALSQI